MLTFESSKENARKSNQNNTQNNQDNTDNPTSTDNYNDDSTSTDSNNFMPIDINIIEIFNDIDISYIILLINIVRLLVKSGVLNNFVAKHAIPKLMINLNKKYKRYSVFVWLLIISTLAIISINLITITLLYGFSFYSITYAILYIIYVYTWL